jgi:predicted membrane-bound spermidine synthase
MNPAMAFLSFTTSFTTMAFSMLMSSLMMEFTGEEVLTQCMTMGPYLMGLGFGSSFGDRVPSSRYLQQLWKLEWISAIVLPAIPLLQVVGVFLFIGFSPSGANLELRSALYTLLTFNGVLSFFSGTLGGAQLPLILKQQGAEREEWILALNYLGPLFAAFVILGMNSGAVPLALQIYVVGLAQSLGIFFLLLTFSERRRRLALLGVSLLCLFCVANLFSRAEGLTVKSLYVKGRLTWNDFLNPNNYLNVLHQYGNVERVRTPYQTIDLFIEPPQLHFGIPGGASVYLNRKPQFDLLSVAVYHETMVYAGLNLLRKTPPEVLILGAGDGLLLKEFRQIPEVKKLTMVELDEGMLAWSRENPVVSQLNGGVLNDIPSQYQLIIGDGITFLRANKKLHELILVDFPFPNGPDLARLYSFEFYTLLRRSLAPGGVVIVDLPLYLDREGTLSRESRTIVKTMRAAGFQQTLLFGPNASFIALSTDEKPLAFDYSRFPEHLSLASYLNFVAPFRENETPSSEWDTLSVNTMFWPRGL